MTQLFSNAARAELAATINDTDTIITITGGGGQFPIANTGTSAIGPGADWFKLTLWDDATGEFEIVYVRTHTSGSDTFSNVIRGQDGTTAREFTAPCIVGLRPTAGDAADWTAKEPAIAGGTTSQYWRGDKTFQTLNKAAVGLPDVDNTPDAAKPVSTLTQAALDNKVDNEAGKGLSTEDYTTDEKNKLAGIATGATDNTGTVASVGMTVPAGLSVSGSPVTGSGTLAVTYAAGYAIPTTSKQSQWDAAYDWGDHASAGYQAQLVSDVNIKTINGDSILGSGDLVVGGGAAVTLSGDTSTYVSQDTMYTITNFNAFATYSVSVSAGSVSRSGDAITFTPPATPQTVTLTVTVDSTPTTFSIIVAEPPAQIVGVALVTEGGGGGAWVHVDANGDTITNPGTSWFNSHPVFGGVQDVTIDGQAMVTIPKFYVKQGVISGGVNNGKQAWWISDIPGTGFELHPAFFSYTTELDQFYIGKYQASMDGSKLASVSGVMPAVSRSLTQFQTDANARNVSGVAGFMLWSVYQWAVIQWLYLVENATMDSQTKTGQGRVNQSSAANVDASDVAQATYRGIVGLWGNVWQWMDGLKTSGGSIHLWDRDGNKTWVNTTKRRTAPVGTIYPTTFMDHSAATYDFADVFIGDTGPTSNSNATAPDYQYFNEDGEFFPIVGGHWSSAADAGLWYVSCNYAASNSYTTIGARLAKV